MGSGVTAYSDAVSEIIKFCEFAGLGKVEVKIDAGRYKIYFVDMNCRIVYSLDLTADAIMDKIADVMNL